MKTSLRYITCALALSVTALTGTISTPAFAADAEKNTDAAEHKKMGDHVFMHEGKLMMKKGGEKSAVTETVTLDNGTKIMTDGSVVMKDGEKAMLKDGDAINMDGKITKHDAKHDDAKKDAKNEGTKHEDQKNLRDGAAASSTSPTTIEEAGKRPTESAPKSN